MALYSSRSQQCFLDDAINDLPEDAHPLTPDVHQTYLQGQAAGKVIDFSTVPPSLIERPPPSIDELATAERVWRDGELLAFDRLIARHRDERDMVRPTTLTNGQFTELLDYRQALRDWPETAGFPNVDMRPLQPEWLAEQQP